VPGPAGAVTRREFLATLAAAPPALAAAGAGASPRADFVKGVYLSYYGVGDRTLREQVLVASRLAHDPLLHHDD